MLCLRIAAFILACSTCPTHGAESPTGNNGSVCLSHPTTCDSVFRRDGASFLQLSATKSSTKRCATPSPQIDGTTVESLIQNNAGLLIIAMPDMRCTQAVTSALKQKHASYTLKEFTGSFAYQEGSSEIWDWLHCTYSTSSPSDANDGTTMHSYVFLKQEFLGQGFKAAETISSGSLDDQLEIDSSATSADDCSQLKDADSSKQVVDRMLAAGDEVVLFGWLSCPCVQIAQTRFSQAGLCLKQRTWANPDDPLMAYLQCRVSDPDSHSFIFFKQTDGSMKFIGNGFAFADDKMDGPALNALIADAGADTTCATQASDKKNIYGGQLEECRVGTDPAGSWEDDGTCTEEFGGVHQICLENIPADFSTATKQSAWSEERAGKRHCVCVGAWSLYMTEEESNPVMPHCRSIPDTVFSTTYIANWKDWNSYPADIKAGVGKLVEKCLSPDDVTDEEKCALKANFESLKSEDEALSTVVPAGLSDLSCS